MSAPLLELKNITKRFPGVLALEDVSVSVGRGEVVALIGENGGGKSTLMNILGGVHQADAGEIRFDGRPVAIRNVADALSLGIGFIHQELYVLDNLDVAANVFLGRERTGGPLRLIDRGRNNSGERGVSEAFRPCDPGADAVRGPVAGATTDGRDRQGAFAKRPFDHHGRANQFAHALGNGTLACHGV